MLLVHCLVNQMDAIPERKDREPNWVARPLHNRGGGIVVMIAEERVSFRWLNLSPLTARVSRQTRDVPSYATALQLWLHSIQTTLRKLRKTLLLIRLRYA